MSFSVSAPPPRSIGLLPLLLLAVSMGVTGPAPAAEVDPQDWKTLRTASLSGRVVPVVVDVVHVSMMELKYQHQAANARTRSFADRLFAELGQEAWRESAIVMPGGQVAVYVTPRGLELLRGSSNALAFRHGMEWHAATLLRRRGADLSRMAQATVAAGIADITITLNVEGLRFRHGADGLVTFQADEAGQASTRELLIGLHSQISQVPGGRSAAAIERASVELPALPSFKPQVRIQVTERELVVLAQNPSVRDMVLSSELSQAPAGVNVGAEVLEAAATQDRVDIVVSLHPAVQAGALSKLSEDAHRASTLAIVEDIKSRNIGLQALRPLSAANAMSGQISKQALDQLLSSNDRRLSAISLNKPMGKPATYISAQQMNLPLVWSTPSGNGFITGQGAKVVVMDSGVQSDHKAFSTQGGTVSRIKEQACFGTTTFNYPLPQPPAQPQKRTESLCPNQDPVTFDSFGIGTGEALHGYSPSLGSHGTSVAGVAAGGSEATNPYNFGLPYRGVAYEADLWSYQVWSKGGGGLPFALFGADVVAALDRLNSDLPTNSPAVVVMSLNFSAVFPGTCNGPVTGGDQAVYDAAQAAVNSLYAKGIAVLASAGNSSLIGQLPAPACLEKVVKVGAYPNRLFSQLGNSLTPAGINSSFSNLPSSVHVASSYTFFAPGGGKSFNDVLAQLTTMSSLTSPQFDPVGRTQIGLFSGTSYAAPQIAGAFALYKSVFSAAPVTEIGSYLQGVGRGVSIETKQPPNSPYLTYKTIRFSSL